jgi:hypothetical protein
LRRALACARRSKRWHNPAKARLHPGNERTENIGARRL